MPLPLGLEVLKGSKSRSGSNSGGIPGPLSLIVNLIPLSSSAVASNWTRVPGYTNDSVVFVQELNQEFPG